MRSLLIISFYMTAIIIAVGVVQPGCNPKQDATDLTGRAAVDRGRYLVLTGGCNDCHSPKIMTPEGPVVDTTRILSGSPDNMRLPSIDTNVIAPGKWYLGSSDLTAWAGPWGVSYSSNLTPDSSTGTGTWTEDFFLKILHSGKFMGSDSGRPIMPPMPWEEIGKMNDTDLKSIFAYLKSIKPIHNAVHAYVAPGDVSRLETGE